jgi:hypothetical protein
MDLLEEFEKKKKHDPNFQYNKWNNLVIIHSDHYTKIYIQYFTHNVVMMIIVVELDECRVIHIDCYKQFVKLLGWM